MKKPIVYIASPYTKGDPGINVHAQMSMFDLLMDDGKVIPVAPLWAHFQHTAFPRHYQDWIDYDMALLPLYAACLRINAKHEKSNYFAFDSDGAEAEAEAFKDMYKPVFHSVRTLYWWVDNEREKGVPS